MVHLSRLAEELVLWSTAEFGFIELADAYSTGSSLMPQKKNPDVPELVRGKAGRAIGNLVALLTVLKGLPLTYNRDLQEDKEPLFDTRAHAARLARGDGRRDRHAARERATRMRAAAEDPMLLATDLAEALVREGVPFREAHEAVGRSRRALRREGASICARSRARICAPSIRRSRRAAASCSISSARSKAARLAGGTARARVREALDAAERRSQQRRQRSRSRGDRRERDVAVRVATRARAALAGGGPPCGTIRPAACAERPAPTPTDSRTRPDDETSRTRPTP